MIKVSILQVKLRFLEADKKRPTSGFWGFSQVSVTE